MGVMAPSGHEAFRGSLVVPVTDTDQRVVQLYGRKIGRPSRGASPHTWLAGGRPLFNAATLVANDEVVLVGSVLDALSVWCAGFHHVVAVAGVEGFDPSHLELLRGHGVGRVLIGFRRDEVGETAATATARVLLGAGIECFRVEFPMGMDANDFALSSANPTDAFGQAIRSASWMGKGPAPSRRRQPPPQAAGASPKADIDEEPDDPAADVLAADRTEAAVEPAVTELAVPDPAAGPLLASPVPPAPTDVEGRWDGEALRLVFGERHWRVRNLEKNTSFDVLRVNVCVSVPASPRGPGFHVDVFDLFSARARAAFVRDAAAEIHVEAKVLKDDLAKVFGAAEAFVEDAIRRAQEPENTTVTLDPDERARAMELLTDRHLVERIVADFAQAGMVGESTNCLVGYLAAISRKLDPTLRGDRPVDVGGRQVGADGGGVGLRAR